MWRLLGSQPRAGLGSEQTVPRAGQGPSVDVLRTLGRASLLRPGQRLQLRYWVSVTCVLPAPSVYPVRCLLPSAHGSCTDWAARWYFIASVGQCNRFWYGGCHGNANNFASEEECVSSCRGPQHGPRRHDPGASGQSTHRDSGGSGPGDQQEASRHGAGPVVQRKPLPSGGLWRQDRS